MKTEELMKGTPLKIGRDELPDTIRKLMDAVKARVIPEDEEYFFETIELYFRTFGGKNR